MKNVDVMEDAVYAKEYNRKRGAVQCGIQDKECRCRGGLNFLNPGAQEKDKTQFTDNETDRI